MNRLYSPQGRNNMEKYKNKYRIPSNRLQGYDYGANGCYFVTICTQNREHYFDAIEMETVAEKFWLEIPQHFPFVILDEFVIMPNHIHGILFFDKNDMQCIHGVDTPKLGVSTPVAPIAHTHTHTPHTHTCGKKQQWHSGTLGVVMNQYKRAVTMYARINNIPFQWQSRFYDSIIRDEIGLNNVRKYIINNPSNWANDKMNFCDAERQGKRK